MTRRGSGWVVRFLKAFPAGFLVLSAACAFTGPASAAAPVVVAGTGTSQALLREIAARYMRLHPGVRIEVPDSIGSGGGIRAAGQGEVDLGRVARKPKKKEAVYGLAYQAFAAIPIVFVASPEIARPAGLTTGQTLDVFSGRIRNWKDLGGPDARIRVISRYEGDSTIALLRKTLPGWADLEITRYAKMTQTDGENARLIAETAGAVGYSNPSLAAAAGLHVFALDGVRPSDPAYPLRIELGIVYKPGSLRPEARDFLTFLYSGPAREIIRRAGAVPSGKP